MKLSTQIIHWLAYAYYVYLFGYASLFKVFEKESMMRNMAALGFDRTWTLAIGYAELLGLAGLIAGFWFHQAKNASVIWLFVFAVGALSAHLAHGDHSYFYGAIFGCIAAVTLLITEPHFRLAL